MCVNYDLTECQVSDLANFMGHADRSHKDHYHQLILTRKIIHVSKLLEAVQGESQDSVDSDISDTEIDADTRCFTDNAIVDSLSTSLNPREVDIGPDQYETVPSDPQDFEEPKAKKQKKKRSSKSIRTYFLATHLILFTFW